MSSNVSCFNEAHAGRPVATYCDKCQKYFCVECEQNFHKSFHNPAPAAKPPVPHGEASRRCPRHRSKLLEWFCQEHYDLCCSDCVYASNGLHKMCPVVKYDDDKTLSEVNERLSTDLDIFSKKIDIMKTLLASLKDKQESYLADHSALKTKIIDTFEDIDKALFKHKKAALEAADALFGELSLSKDIAQAEELLITSKDLAAEAVNRPGVDRPSDILRLACAVRNELTCVAEFEKLAAEKLCSSAVMKLQYNESALNDVVKVCTEESTSDQIITGKESAASVLSRLGSSRSLSKLSEEIVCDDKPVVSKSGLSCRMNELMASRTQTIDESKCYNFSVWRDGGWHSEVVSDAEESPFKNCAWKECPDTVNAIRRCVPDPRNPKIATMLGNGGWGTIMGNMTLPANKVTSWDIKILQSETNDGDGILIGVAPFDIDQGYERNTKRGWYLHCWDSTLWSGLPHNYDLPGKSYGPRRGCGNYIQAGGVVGVVMDTSEGDLSFIINDVNFGVAYEDVPLDKPLVPVILPYHERDSFEIIPSEVKENVDSSIPAPQNFSIQANSTWDSLMLTWNTIEGASFYQIEVDRNKFLEASTQYYFLKMGLPPESVHSFRVRTVRGSKVSLWSRPVEGKTQREVFEYSTWKECPKKASWELMYVPGSWDPKIVSKLGNGDGHPSVVIGNTPIPQGQNMPWNITITNLWEGKGRGLNVGVAPFDTDQLSLRTTANCGWNVDCFSFKLYSGPPHNYKGKDYCSGAGISVHNGDTIGVIMDMTRAELTLLLNGINFGVAYKCIPLDKPLVPLVLLWYRDDSVGFSSLNPIPTMHNRR